jgi:hypothetical protein
MPGKASKLFSVVLATVSGCSDEPVGSNVNRIHLEEGNGRFLLGVNYPWRHYGHDFGETGWGHDGVSSQKSKSQVDTDFDYLKQHGVRVVRWFLFGDGRASPEFDAGGKVTGFDKFFYLDLDTALSIAEKHDISLILVLLDFKLATKAEVVNGVQIGGRSRVITDPIIRKSFLDGALVPLLTQYGQHRHIIAWEVMNEPEWPMSPAGHEWDGDTISESSIRAFIRDVVECIHTRSPHQVTVGSASRQYVSLWRECGLDFYQIHYYDWMEPDFPLADPVVNLGLDKPCIVGEFPTKNTSRTISQYLDTISQSGYAGALAWSYRGEDESSDFKSVAVEFADWGKAH